MEIMQTVGITIFLRYVSISSPQPEDKHNKSENKFHEQEDNLHEPILNTFKFQLKPKQGLFQLVKLLIFNFAFGH